MISGFKTDNILGTEIENELNLLGLNPEQRAINVSSQELKEIIIATSTLYAPIDTKDIPIEYIQSAKVLLKDFDVNDPDGKMSQGFLSFIYKVKDQAIKYGVDYTNNETGNPVPPVNNLQDLLNGDGKSSLQDYSKILISVKDSLERAGIYQENFETTDIVIKFATNYTNSIEKMIQIEQGCIQKTNENGTLDPAIYPENCANPQGQTPVSFKP